MKYLFILILISISPAFAKKPNIVIISIDSFKRETSFSKNFNPAFLPELDKFTDHGYLFKNTFTENAWANLSLWLSKIPNDVYKQSGYNLIGLGWKVSSLRKISAEKNPDLPLNFYIMIPSEPNKFEKGFAYLENEILAQKEKSFFIDIHLKELHPPLFIKERINTSLLSRDSRDLLAKYLANPEKFAEKVVLFSVLFDEALRLNHSPQTLSALIKLVESKRLPRSILKLRYVNLTLMDNLLDIWKQSEGYRKDLTLIDELYHQRQSFLDSKLKDFFSFLNKNKLTENTLFIVVSNFGFATMEHGQLFNSVANYDEFIGTHLFIKPPSAAPLKMIQEQASLKGLGKFIYALLQSKEASFNIKENLHYIFDPEVISSNYNHDLFAIRANNEWKLHLDLVHSKRLLFNVKNDPKENDDLFHLYHNKAAELETIILKKIINEGANE